MFTKVLGVGVRGVDVALAWAIYGSLTASLLGLTAGIVGV